MSPSFVSFFSGGEEDPLVWLVPAAFGCLLFSLTPCPPPGLTRQAEWVVRADGGVCCRRGGYSSPLEKNPGGACPLLFFLFFLFRLPRVFLSPAKFLSSRLCFFGRVCGTKGSERRVCVCFDFDCAASVRPRLFPVGSPGQAEGAGRARRSSRSWRRKRRRSRRPGSGPKPPRATSPGTTSARDQAATEGTGELWSFVLKLATRQGGRGAAENGGRRGYILERGSTTGLLTVFEGGHSLFVEFPLGRRLAARGSVFFPPRADRLYRWMPCMESCALIS